MNPEVATAAVDAVAKIGAGTAAATEGGVGAGLASVAESVATPEIAAPTTPPVAEQMSFRDIGGADFVDNAAVQAANSPAPNAEAEIQGLVDKFTADDFDDATLDRLAAAENDGKLEWENGQPVIHSPDEVMNATRIGGTPGELPKVAEPSMDTAVPPGQGKSVENGMADQPDQANTETDEATNGNNGSGTVAEADAPAPETPEEAPADMTDVEPTAIDANPEPEAVRDQLSSRIDELKAKENPTPDEKKELSKANLELAERDRRDTLNAAEPDSLTADDAAERDRLNGKYGTPDAEAAAAAQPPTEETSQELTDPGQFDEQAVRHQIENDRNRKDWTEDQKEAYVSAQRAEHDKKKAEYDAAMKEKGEKQELSTEQQKQKLDQELQKVQQDLIDGKITAKEASERLTANRHARETIVRSLVERFRKGEEMTPFEKEVAEKSIQMQQLMREIQMAPKVMTAMEATIKKLKAEYTKAAGYQINAQNADSPDTRQNIALRSQLSNQIAAQATHMARYADITSINVNEFKSVNSSLMNLIGVRGTLRNMMVQIGTGIRRKAKTYEVDIKARRIAQGWKV